jgi:flagellar hook-basal body complex protein FliE
MMPISVIPQAMSAYGIQPADLTTSDVAKKLPGMEGVIPGQPASDPFGSMLGQFIQDVNTKQVDAGNAVASLQAGGNVSLHQAVIAMEEANVSFQLMVEVRNKLLEAYQELMRMSM